ncbi:MAG: hypothetical protein K5707_01780 [Clostridia bacterium]|nr:hypothetical protein [Clostridia bacterium]
MTKIQTELLLLLKEFDQVCDKLQVNYFLIENLLLYSHLKKDMAGYEADVVMLYRDFKKLKAYVEGGNLPEREIEGLHDNPQMPGLYFRYVKSDSLLMDLDYYNVYTKFGIAINIHILRTCGRAEKLMARGEKELFRAVQNRVPGEVNEKRFWVKHAPMVKPVSFKLLERVALKSTERPSRIKLPQGKKMDFPEDYFSEFQIRDFYGYPLKTVVKIEDFLIRRYGRNWRKAKGRVLKENYMVAANPNLPYRKYLQGTDLSVLNKEFFRERKRYLTVNAREVVPLNKQERYGWNVLFFTENRIKLARKYEPLKEQILREWDAGNHDKAMLMLKDYREKLEEYQKKELTLYFDEELFRICLTWYRENERFALADKLEAGLITQHLEGEAAEPEESGSAAEEADNPEDEGSKEYYENDQD